MFFLMVLYVCVSNLILEVPKMILSQRDFCYPALNFTFVLVRPQLHIHGWPPESRQVSSFA